jgi:hypothetical protein
MENNPCFEVSFWFTRVLESKELKYDELKNKLRDVDDTIYASFIEIIKKKGKILEENSSHIEHIFLYLLKVASKSKFNGAKEFSDAYSKLFNREMPQGLKNCFIEYSEIYDCLNLIYQNDAVIRIDINQIFNWIGEYLDLFIMLELTKDIVPSKKGRHRNQLDTEIRDYLSIRSKYLSNEDDINLFKYKKFRNYNFHWLNRHKVRPEMIVDFMSNIFSEKINRIDNFYLPNTIKQIWFVKDINDRQICSIIIPLIQLLKSIDQRSSHRIFHITEEAFKNDPIISKGGVFTCYDEYCYIMINRLVKTKH